MKKYLQASEVIDWQHSAILNLAQKLATDQNGKVEIARSCFEWVRDQIYHSYDYQMNPVTCKASDVLKHGTGYCFAKSHLLAALLRANDIPTGFCYQRLSVNDDDAALYSLHGFNAVYLSDFGWYRIDPRGNKLGVNAQFSPPKEQLAYAPNLTSEWDCQKIFSEPLSVVVKALNSYKTWNELLINLPDIEHIYLEANRTM